MPGSLRRREYCGRTANSRTSHPWSSTAGWRRSAPTSATPAEGSLPSPECARWVSRHGILPTFPSVQLGHGSSRGAWWLLHGCGADLLRRVSARSRAALPEYRPPHAPIRACGAEDRIEAARIPAAVSQACAVQRQWGRHNLSPRSPRGNASRPAQRRLSLSTAHPLTQVSCNSGSEAWPRPAAVGGPAAERCASR